MRVALPKAFATLFMKSILRDYQNRYPMVELDVFLSDDRVDLVAESIDVAVRIAREPDPTIIAKRCSFPVEL